MHAVCETGATQGGKRVPIGAKVLIRHLGRRSKGFRDRPAHNAIEVANEAAISTSKWSDIAR